MKKAYAIPCLRKIAILLPGILFHLAVAAQCSNGLMNSISYDTLVTGSGNDTYNFTVPKFSPAVGTLVAVRINAIVSVNYGFLLKNVEHVNRNFSVEVDRYDYFQSAAMASAYSNLVKVNLGTFPLAPGSSVSRPVNPVLTRYKNTDSITTNVASFLGAGSVSFDYEPITYTTLLGSANYYYSASANDTTHFSVTYFYCNVATLPLDLKSFDVEKENNDHIKLSWATANEVAGRNYEIEKSEDGSHFITVGSVPSNGDGIAEDYGYNYTITTTDKNRIFFRLKGIDANGAINYSEVRMVDIGNGPGGLTVYPSPAKDFINIGFNQSQNTDWQVEIFASHGGLVERKFYPNSNTARLVFSCKPAAGLYFMRVTNQRTQQNYFSSFVVQ